MNTILSTAKSFVKNKSMDFGNVCGGCKRIKTNDKLWCRYCAVEHFQNKYSTWTSGNKDIDLLIIKSHLFSQKSDQIIEWIPYKQLEDIQNMTKGGYSAVSSAIWLDGPIEYWDSKRREWSRKSKYRVALKFIKKSSTTNDRVLNELGCHIKCNGQKYIIRLYGISNNPETDEYIMVIEYADSGSLRNYLINKGATLSLKDKLKIFEQLAAGLSSIHEAGLIHRDLHPGNILVNNNVSYLSDLGLSVLTERLSSNNILLTTISNLIKNGLYNCNDPSHTCDDSTYVGVEEAHNYPVYTHSTNNSTEQKKTTPSYSIETTYLSGKSS
ncbi:15466_t:CDS:2 [Dentiscutata heterogama]|uniref:15466_t:CDS:1 n=1 Tax=Dentiscutata heterogama TaxID=1316150 RepID=A0ACA9JYS8_9GLOM|nr:15466_t:CDS:2 [Dentiscutata heterogama]